VSLREQMDAVELLMRRPGELGRLAAAGGGDAAVLATIDPARLEAVARVQAGLVLARWWAPRFPAVVAALTAGASRAGLAADLVAADAFEAAQGEDELGSAFCGGLLELAAAGWEAPDGLLELLAYEYLLAVGLPRRAVGEPVDADLEARLFAASGVSRLTGGRLARPVVVGAFAAPVSALHEDPAVDPEAVEAPEAVLLLADAEGATEVGVGAEVVDALELLAGGAPDAALADALGTETWAELRADLAELGVLAPGS